MIRNHDPRERTNIRMRMLENGFEPIPITCPWRNSPKWPASGKAPGPKGWSTVRITPEIVQSWARNGGWPGTGMRTGRVVVADIDIDERRADAIERIAESILGVTEWCRYGGSLKRALVYRCDRPIRPGRTAPYRDESGAKFQVEIKGAGNQIVAFGVHPKMKRPYAWEACEPYRNRFDELPATTAEQWKEFDEAAEAYLAEQSDLTRDERAGANCGFGDALYVLTPNTVIEIVRPGREITTYGEICEWIPPDYDAQRSDVWCNAPEEHWPGRRSDSGMVHVFRPHRLAMPVLCDFPRSVTLYAACESPAAREARVMGLEKIAGLLP